MPNPLKSKQKNKIDALEYNRILKSLKLIRIALINCEAKLNDDIKINDKVSINIDSDGKSFKYKSNKLEVLHRYILKGISLSNNKNYISIQVTFQITYKTSDLIDDNFFDIFKENSLEFVTWPYFREFVNNVTARMYIPPLIIPQIIR